MRNKLLLVAGLTTIAGSALFLLVTGNTGIRYSADHTGTTPMWLRWIPALVGIVLVRLVPSPSPGSELEPDRSGRRRAEAVVLLVLAVLFAVSLRLLGGGEPAHTALKSAILLVALVVLRRNRITARPGLAPVPAVVAWVVLIVLLTPASDYADTVGPVTLLATIVVVFLVNALLEEVFYRRWLQTRWEATTGRWAGIVLTSLVWAAWHVGIQGTDRLAVDLASAFVNQGVQGLFLGYLWSRYRAMWPPLVVHGAMNAAPVLVGAVT
ncbi:CPBP family intramembrane glutamic endopeptidase [Saccharothrix xinjiangensis]|uniref:CPBP family intramembrane glutamic endopeptidase n=1 Tax=Saccharothrix xinjiangensis TaxID=204798 RepID=A0ABV9XTU5_9PSEU